MQMRVMSETILPKYTEDGSNKARRRTGGACIDHGVDRSTIGGIAS